MTSPIHDNAVTTRALGTTAISGAAVEEDRSTNLLSRLGNLLSRRAEVVQQDGTGLAAKKAAKKYAEAMEKIQGSVLGSSDLKARIAALAKPANAALATIGVPEVSAIEDPLDKMRGTADQASFVRGNWQIWFNPDIITGIYNKQTFARAANTVYHEYRHAEQAFRVARKLATEGKDAAYIANTITIPIKIAEEAVKKPLSPGSVSPQSAQEWGEAEEWEYNISINPRGGKSPAGEVNTEKEEAEEQYGKARNKWRPIEKSMNDPSADEEVRRRWKDYLSKPENSANIAGIKKDYDIARQWAAETYKMYANMPVEKDAWTTGGLIQELLGFPAARAEDELNNLDADEREMRPININTWLAAKPTSKSTAGPSTPRSPS